MAKGTSDPGYTSIGLPVHEYTLEEIKQIENWIKEHCSKNRAEQDT